MLNFSLINYWIENIDYSLDYQNKKLDFTTITTTDPNATYEIIGNGPFDENRIYKDAGMRERLYLY